MALSQVYVNEVLNHLPSTVVVDETVWPELIRLLHYEDRDLNTLIIGQMKLRMAKGGYEGLMADLSSLLKENTSLRAQVTELTKQVETLTAPVETAPLIVTSAETVHA